MRNPDDYRAAIRQRLEGQNVTLQQLAEKVPYSYSHVSNVLAGSSGGSLFCWLNLLDAVGLELVVMDRRGD